MTESTQPGSVVNFGDVSQKNVYSISQQGPFSVGSNKGKVAIINEDKSLIEVDREVANLLEWLSEQQGISPEIALKKAVATAAYIHDITTNQGGKLLVQRKDKFIGEIVLH
jgi:hypothetical protein